MRVSNDIRTSPLRCPLSEGGQGTSGRIRRGYAPRRGAQGDGIRIHTCQKGEMGMKWNLRRLPLVLGTAMGVTTAFALLDWLKWDLFYVMNTFSGITGILMMAMYLAFFLSVIALCARLCRGWAHRWVKTALLVALCLVAIVGYFGFMCSDVYLKLNYRWQQSARLEILSQLESGELARYQSGMQKYGTPYRFASQNKYIYVNANKTQVEFISYRGLDTIYEIVYTADGLPPVDTPYWQFADLEGLDPHWYAATIKVV